MGIHARRRHDRRLASLPVHPYERARRLRHRVSRHVRERAVACNHGVHGAVGGRHHIPFDRHRRAIRLQSGQIERHRPQRAGRCVDEMTARHVVGVTAASEEHGVLPGLHIQDRHLCGIKAAGHRRDREQHGPTARQPFRPDVISFAPCGVGPREDRRRPAACRGDLLQAGCPVRGREDDGVIGSPRRAERRGCVGLRQGNCRPSGHRHFLQHAAVHEADPQAIGGDKRPARRAGEHRHRLEGV